MRNKEAWSYAFNMLLWWIVGYCAGLLHEDLPSLPWIFILSWAAGNLAGWLATHRD